MNANMAALEWELVGGVDGFLVVRTGGDSEPERWGLRPVERPGEPGEACDCDVVPSDVNELFNW